MFTDEIQLSVPAEITLYKIGSYEQVIPCHKSEQGTVFWRHRGVLKYKTSEQDCSLVMRFVSEQDFYFVMRFVSGQQKKKLLCLH